MVETDNAGAQFQGSNQFKVKPFAIGNGHFVKEDGRTKMPSLMDAESERNLKIWREFKVDGAVTLHDGVSQIKRYEIGDQYLDTLDQLDRYGKDLYWLKFIARFKSVQTLQLLNQVDLATNLFRIHDMWQSVNKLIRFGLVQKWAFMHPVTHKKTNSFSLTGNGFRFLETFWGKQRFFQPQNYYYLRPWYHIRFWETVDIYQALASLPAFEDFSTMFNGAPHDKGEIIASPLQICLQLTPKLKTNLIFYTCLQTDGPKFYQNVLNRWSVYTKEGKKLQEPVNRLPKALNTLTFYSPTLEAANHLSQIDKMQDLNYPVMFLIGQIMKSEGIPHAFYLPDNATGELKQMNLTNLLKPGEKNE